MGVDYYIVCDEHKEKVGIYSLPYGGDVVINQLLDGSLTKMSFVDVPVWIRPFLDDRYTGKIDTTIEFKERHKDCRLTLRNDHTDDFDDRADEYSYFADVDYTELVDRTEDFLENIRTKSPMFIRVINRISEQYPDAKFVLRNSPPFDYYKREDVTVTIPVKEHLGTFKDIMSLPGCREELFSRDVWRTCDGRLFYTVQNTLMEWISEEGFEKIKAGE